MADVDYRNPNNKNGKTYLKIHNIGESNGIKLPMEFTKISCKDGTLNIDYNDCEMEIIMHDIDINKVNFTIGY